MVDDEDYPWLSEDDWRLQKDGYVVRSVSMGKRGSCRTIYLHRVVMNVPLAVEIDHRKHNKLDNRKSQLRIASKSQNAQNSRKQKRHTSSRFKGVCWQHDSLKWRTYITVRRKRIHLGLFEEEIEAAHAYNRFAEKVFQPFANMNKFTPEELNLLHEKGLL